MVPITRRASFPNKKMLYSLIKNKPILICSKLAASIVQDTFAREAVETKEAKRRLLEATSTATSTGTFTAQARKSFRFLALELNSHANTEGGSGYPRLNARMGIRNRRTYIYISRVSINMTK